MIFLFRIELRFQILLTEHLQNMRNEYFEFEINLFSRLGGDSRTNIKNENFVKVKRGCVITQIRWGVRPRFFSRGSIWVQDSSSEILSKIYQRVEE